MIAKVSAVAGVVVSAAIGYVTNVVTGSFSWALFAVLLSLVALAGALVCVEQGRSLVTSVRQRADREGKIKDSPIAAANGGSVDDRATRGGTIISSPIKSKGGQVKRRVSRSGSIEGGGIEVD